ncbi:ferritin-like domain-containing protein [Mumia sp. zg.B17]|uniref:ferritin-like domain-containing protein n=1 Tax=Mumia sp. zg.B17 TaxID=2855446 RepID=UPI001C6E1FC4|nr:ferritin-like domain-containing protein [Mumia sp. zg.B17]MBW9205490.1 ferritin-like domain-containing protein [Mumia sp. zg.B17]
MRTTDEDPAGFETDPTDALQNALAGEHAAVYSYGLVAGRLEARSPVQRQAAGAFALHRKRRDDLRAWLAQDKQDPVDPEPAYATGQVATASDARRLAQQVESGLVRSWLAVVGVTEGERRAYACAAVDESATALLAWGGKPTALPGID